VLAFLDDVKAHPEDDGPRLILADWLEDHGDPRGELVRVQCQLARLPADNPHRPQLEERERALLAEHLPTWLAGLPGIARHAEVCRGLIRLWLYAEQIQPWLEGPFRATEACAWVDGVWGHNLRANALFTSVAVAARAGLVSLRLSGGSERIPDTRFVALANSPDLARLRELALTNFYFGSAAATALANSPHLAKLTSLSLHANRAYTGAFALGSSPHLARLRTLDLSSNSLGDRQVQAFAGGGGLRSLTDLRLASNKIGGRGLAALVASSLLERLTHLDLNGNHLRGDDVRLFADSPTVRRLELLNLGSNRLSGKSAQAIVSSPNLANLTTLWLAHNNAGDRGAELIATDLRLPRLVHLDLRTNGIGDKGAIALAASPLLAQLRTLHLGYNRIGRAGARALAESPYLGGLTMLALSGHRPEDNPIGEEARRALQERFGARLRLAD
jgi:uncharacterized protein (TIGR02996 family)